MLCNACFEHALHVKIGWCYLYDPISACMNFSRCPPNRNHACFKSKLALSTYFETQQHNIHDDDLLNYCSIERTVVHTYTNKRFAFLACNIFGVALVTIGDDGGGGDDDDDHCHTHY